MYATLNMLQMSLFKKFLWNTIGWIAGIKQSSTRHYSFLNLLFFVVFHRPTLALMHLARLTKGIIMHRCSEAGKTPLGGLPLLT